MSDGLGKEVIVKTNLVWPNGIAIDYDDTKIFWVDASTDKLEKSNLDGHHREVLIDGQRLYHPYSVTVYKDRVYWTDWQQHSIEHINKYNGGDRVSINGHMTRPTAVRVYAFERQPGSGIHVIYVTCSYFFV